MKTCRYCRKKIKNNDNRGWVGKDGLRRCFANNEVMLKEHVPMLDSTLVDQSAKKIYATTVVIIDEDKDLVYTYQAVDAEKLREICDEHSMNFDDAAYVVDERVKSLGSTTFMFRLPIFNQYHQKEN